MTATVLPAAFSSIFPNSNVITTTATDELIELQNETVSLFNQAVADCKLIRREKKCVCQISHGKDSEITLLANLKAHIELIEEGAIEKDVPFVVCNIDTEIESILTQILVLYMREKLQEAADKFGINLVYIQGRPPLNKLWASLFLSGRKLYSTTRTNSDCSIMLKIDSAKQITKKIEHLIGTDYVTMIGTRLDESKARASKMRKRKLLKASDLIETSETISKKVRQVYGPIKYFEDRHVWFYLKHAGSNPLMQTYDGSELFSYQPNYRLLRLFYSESELKTVCPDSDLALKGAGSAGSCGSSSSPRQGCFLCLQNLKDKSASALNQQHDWHFYIAGNLQRFRDWLMSQAHGDLSNRVWHSRAVDQTTGALSMIPNVMSGEHYDKAIRYASQLTIDERVRAKRLRMLRDTEQLELDPGYISIMNNQSLDPEDRALLLEVYTKYAVEPLINIIDDEIALFLSLIHSRDGIQLAPYTALANWYEAKGALEEAELRIYDSWYSDSPRELLELSEVYEEVKSELIQKGQWLPYPEPINISEIETNEIPDARLIFPKQGNLAIYGHLDTAFVESDAFNDCTHYLEDSSASMNKTMFNRFFENCESVHQRQSSEKVEVRYLTKFPLIKVARSTPKPIKRKFEGSSRPVTKRLRQKGISRVIGRGRTSTDSPSFGKRRTVPRYEESMFTELSIVVPTTEQILRRDYYEIDSDVADSISINCESANFWFSAFAHDIKANNYITKDCDLTECDKALQKHYDYVSMFGRYSYQGVSVFHSLMRFGVFAMSSRAKRHCERICKRTDYFREIGIFNELTETLLRRSMSMADYRKTKVVYLLEIRKLRNRNRAELRKIRKSYDKTPAEYFCDLAVQITQRLEPYVETVVSQASVIGSLAEHSSGFDTVNFNRYLDVLLGWLDYYISDFRNFNHFASLVQLDKKMSEFCSTPSNKNGLLKILDECGDILQKAADRGYQQSKSILNGTQTPESGIINASLFYLREQHVSFTAMPSFELKNQSSGLSFKDNILGEIFNSDVFTQLNDSINEPDSISIDMERSELKNIDGAPKGKGELMSLKADSLDVLMGSGVF